MESVNVRGSYSSRPIELCRRKSVKVVARVYAVGGYGGVQSPRLNVKEINSNNSLRPCFQSANRVSLLSLKKPRRPKHVLRWIDNKIRSDCSLDPCDVEEISESNQVDQPLQKTFKLIGTSAVKSDSQNVKSELILLALPAIGGQVLEPFAQLMETAFIGRLGPVELASAGVSISIFNIISKLFNIPLLSVATSFVAEDISRSSEESSSGRKQLASVSTAFFLAGGIGIFEAVALYFGSGLFLNMMGITSASPMRVSAQQFLSLRAIGAPAVVVSLALQGVFRGFKDTKTPLICLGAGNLTAVFLFPLLVYSLRLGVTGAAIATVISQYLVTFFMIWSLSKRAILLPPKLENLNFGSYLKSGGFLLGRTLAILSTMTLGTSMAARQGPIAMAAHQICLQVWLAVSLLTDALASSGQAIIASSFSKHDYRAVKEITFYLVKVKAVLLFSKSSVLRLLTGTFLAVALGASFGIIPTLFTKDADVLGIVKSMALLVCASQPINALAFIADGLYYGVSDFAYAAQSMMVAGGISSVFLLYAPSKLGLTGVWLGLVLCMTLRMTAGFVRLKMVFKLELLLQFDFEVSS
ncbi:hypothetical protein Scep_000153 [Stephania cephalantha]|uniref:Protein DETOXIFICATION n=1 Tax=Stephania cephalantha TaxID=152367 RepID=A0AAP0Q258_9MAGN